MNIYPRLIGLTVAVCAIAAASCAISAPAKTIDEMYPTLATDGLRFAVPADLSDGVILESGELKIKPNDLNEQIRLAPEEFWPQMKRNLFFVLETYVGALLLQYEAEEWVAQNPNINVKPDDEELILKFLAYLTNDVTVSDDDVNASLEAEKKAHPDVDFEKVKDQFKKLMLDQMVADARRDYISGIGKRYVIKVDQKWLAKQHSAAMDNPIDRARKSGKPTVVSFDSETSEPSKKMKPVFEAVAKDYSNKANIVLIKIEKEPVLGSRFAIDAVPAQLFFDKDGKEAFRHMGLFTKEQIAEKLLELSNK